MSASEEFTLMEDTEGVADLVMCATHYVYGVCVKCIVEGIEEQKYGGKRATVEYK